MRPADEGGPMLEAAGCGRPRPGPSDRGLADDSMGQMVWWG